MRMGAPRLQISLRRGLTLVEMMVSLVCVIILMLAYTQLFSDVGSRVSDARAMIEMTNRMRSAEHRLRADLVGATCDMTPWQRPEDGAGYMEIIEGIASDSRPPIANGWDNTQPVLGDTDDTLMFTTRSKEGPFIGRYAISATQTITVQSDVAEVVWFMRKAKQSDGKTDANPVTYNLYRRAFLVMPTYQGSPTPLNVSPQPGQWNLPQLSFYEVNDISAHYEEAGNGSMRPVASSLGDLTKRECRFGHKFSANSHATANSFPHGLVPDYFVPFGGTYVAATANTAADVVLNTADPRYGEDVVLTNVVAFDIQVWDPTAPVYIAPNANNPQVAVGPSDPGFTKALVGTPPNANQPQSIGAFVDLNWLDVNWDPTNPTSLKWNNNLILSPFCSRGHPKSQLMANFSNASNATAATFDTWSYHYEHDGLDQDKAIGDTHGPDQGTNGFDDDGNGIVDDVGERETSPPYPVPLRGIKIRIRCYEPDSRQVHEISIIHSFVPE
jgi:type II secretory pathway component PulJ